jgi:integrase/recombinase XerD
MPVTMSFKPDKRSLKKKTGKHPIVLLVSCNGSERYQTIYEATQAEFKKLEQKNVPYYLLQLKDTLRKILREAETAAEALNQFTFTKFETTFLLNNEHFLQTRFKRKLRNALPSERIFDFSPYYKKFPIITKNPVPEIDTIAYQYLIYIKEKIRKGKIGTATSLHSGYNSFMKFGGNKPLLEITSEYLFDYEQWMRGKGKSRATVGIYTRTLRTIYLFAVKKKVIKRDDDIYPFGKNGFVMPKIRKRNRALTLTQLSAIYHSEHELVTAIRAKEFWFFLFDANGMNTKDMALLKYGNISGDYLAFERVKTEDTARHDIIRIQAYITDDMKRTIERWGNKEKSPDNYIFPILEPGITPLREYELIQNFTGYINTWMIRIVKSLGMDGSLGTTGKTRHSRATQMVANGASLFAVKDALGHHNITTTELYVNSLESDELATLSKRIADKVKEKPLPNTLNDGRLFEHEKRIV